MQTDKSRSRRDAGAAVPFPGCLVSEFKMLKLSRFFSSSRGFGFSSEFSVDDLDVGLDDLQRMMAGKLLPKNVDDVKDTLCLGYSASHQYSTGITDSTSSGRTFADFTVFKGKGAMSMQPVMPKFSKLDSGSAKVDKKGVVLLTFMPASGTRKYDWEKRQYFALSPIEVGSLISLQPNESAEFFHDPSMKSSLEGQVKKSLSVSPMGSDGGYFFSISISNNIQKTNDRLSVPVTKAEFAVMRTACSFVLPHIMGWDRIVKPEMGTGAAPPPKHSELRLDPDFEWGR